MAKKVEIEEKEIDAPWSVSGVEPYELPEGWKWIHLLDTFENKTSSKKKLPTNEYCQTGRYAVIDQGQDFIGGYSDKTELVFDGELPVIVFGDHTKCIKYIDFAFIQGADGIKVLKPIKAIDERYFYYGLQSINFPDLGYRRHFPIFKNYLFPLPTTIEEQQRIVNRIESMFAKLDEAKEKAQNVVDSFETRKAAILHQAFTGNLTAKWRKENGVTNESWEEKKLEDVCEFITKGTTPKKEDMTIGFGDIPYIKVYNLCFDTSLDFTVDPTFVKKESHENFLARSITLPGDVLMNIVGPPFGKVSIVPDYYPEWNINQAIARFRCKEELLNLYLANYLISPRTIENMSRKIKTTAGQQNLTLEICRNISIFVPSISEQQEIVRILDTVLEKERTAKSAAEQVLEQIDLLKKSILARAFRGEL